MKKTTEKKLTKAEKKALLNIAKKHLYQVERRGDLEERRSDSEDFLDSVAVWDIEAMLEDAYPFGKEIMELK